MERGVLLFLILLAFMDNISLQNTVPCARIREHDNDKKITISQIA